MTKTRRTASTKLVVCYCAPCDTKFKSQHLLGQHLRHSDRHRFDCQTCFLHFRTAPELHRYRGSSACHNICRACNPERDFYSPGQLSRHQKVAHNTCHECNEAFDSAGEFREHNALEHYMCRLCDQLLWTASCLQDHLKTHVPKNVACYGCPEKFVSVSDMILHLETRACPSGADIRTVDNAAFTCCYGESLRSGDPCSPFACPYCCSTTFRFMSGLLQHAELDHHQASEPFEDLMGMPYTVSPPRSFLDTLEWGV